MRFLDLVHARRSVRRYETDRPVEREKLDRCLEAARLAPSASNAQPWRFVVVDDPALRERVAQETFGPVVSFNHFSLQAPALVVCVAEDLKFKARLGGLIKNRRYSGMDMGIAAAHFCLQAVEEGLGTCMLGWFDEKGVRRALGIPAWKRVGLIITVGYPARDAPTPARARKALDEVRAYNRY
jgi:nitroreductase